MNIEGSAWMCVYGSGARKGNKVRKGENPLDMTKSTVKHSKDKAPCEIQVWVIKLREVKSPEFAQMLNETEVHRLAIYGKEFDVGLWNSFYFP